jgi:hypothetical protein
MEPAMNELVLWSLLGAAALLVATITWLRRRAQARQQRVRREGWRLVHDLKAYGAWLEALRGEYAAAAESEESVLASAEALRSARAIMQGDFPALLRASDRLVQGDSRLVALLWPRRVHRGEEAAGRRPAQPAAGYRELLEDQLDLVEELIARCQVLTGDRDAVWQGTDIDADFAPSFNLSAISTR